MNWLIPSQYWLQIAPYSLFFFIDKNQFNISSVGGSYLDPSVRPSIARRQLKRLAVLYS